MRLIAASTTFALFAWSVLAAQTDSFTFAGLGLNTTMAELKQRYPKSHAVEALVRLSDEESHDHISTIGLSSNRGVRTLAITFERQQRGRKPTYPSCDSLQAPLRERYGDPASIVDTQEERARNRRFEWKTPAETLTLRCFRMPRQPLYAERLTISSGP